MDLDLHGGLGPRVPVSCASTLRRLLAYLGATPAQVRDVESSLQSHAQGNVRITLKPGPQESAALAWPALVACRGENVTAKDR